MIISAGFERAAVSLEMKGAQRVPISRALGEVAAFQGKVVPFEDAKTGSSCGKGARAVSHALAETCGSQGFAGVRIDKAALKR